MEIYLVTKRDGVDHCLFFESVIEVWDDQDIAQARARELNEYNDRYDTVYYVEIFILNHQTITNEK